PNEAMKLANAYGVPLMRSPLMSSVFINRMTKFLDDSLAPTTSVHGVLIDVLGIGVLLMGKSGIGKSEAALDLVLRGHRLVADDIVEIKAKGTDAVYGAGSELIRHHMEIRGLGIINIKDLFGVASVRERKKIELVIELVEWDERHEYDRLRLEQATMNIVGVEVPHAVVPVRPGRNMTTIVEVAARNHLLKLQGHHSAQEVADKLAQNSARARADGDDDDKPETSSVRRLEGGEE